MGYDKDHVIILHIGYPELLKNYTLLKNELLKNPGIIAVSAASQLPVDIITSEGIDVRDDKYKYWAYYNSIDPDFFRTMDIKILSGKENIENLIPENYANKYVVNESALKEIGWTDQNALGQQIIIRHGNMKPGPVIGVVKDFNFQSLHYPVNPLVFEFIPKNYEYLLVRINPVETAATLGFIGHQWEKFSGGIPFDYHFLDNDYDQLYKSETRTGKLFTVFSFISTIIALLGLFGLASYAALKRTREIGIRKVFGATSLNILKLLSGDFARLVIIAFILSVPVSWYMMNKWLEEFAYRISISPLLMVLAGVVVITLALVTVGYHSLRAANTDPVKTLRYE